MRRAAALWPFSLPYALAVAARNGLYDLGLARVKRAGIPVVSVGNITAGGTGKTPFTLMLAALLSRSGRRVAIVSRGYRREKGAKGPLLVSDGREIRCPAAEAGDEPYLMARKLLGSGAMVIVGADRVKSAGLARELKADIVVLDDGFQHRRLHRNINIVLLDSRRPFGNGLRLPAGMLRESPGSLKRADALVLTRAGDEGEPPGLRKRLRPGVPVFRSRHVPESLVEIQDWRRGKTGGPGRPVHGEVLLFSGIANPGSFEQSAEAVGLKVGGHVRFPDHHRYRPTDLGRIESAGAGFEAAVTTEKDAVRLPGEWKPALRLAVLGISLELVPEESRSLLERMIMEKASAP
ncbi:MAG TPA: tetraacyldisaccharide 4'-kinase [candidate division Zixibacteria bacterium]|nr:tetraacyldisaccharide 4'-kinase [candidate division Zixibacteria bacterium]